ncbi:hypothetical protein GUITHDRAFT_140616 [Guillardia theta CCMP2712]|uniref:Uncharacterized protein n=1 Tax=Guillardia theta (strain CCMP2712) TaxID=905079 RepID=L1J5C7_GUITC|nr:hypothetical protein GUITHDRAFT_140616 [Guillardia theta CCMP2712]EKX43304.1 hypothetical protein GUITHDRAFT_140616 [Guillardia theta CCMP2712]|eukprot:XP_005830284.1 hypothetical protein GUITHDRAFT_140616 [Guillardia theta CCMP2712]
MALAMAVSSRHGCLNGLRVRQVTAGIVGHVLSHGEQKVIETDVLVPEEHHYLEDALEVAFCGQTIPRNKTQSVVVPEGGEQSVVFHFGLILRGGRQRRAAQGPLGHISNVAIRSSWGSGLSILSGRWRLDGCDVSCTMGGHASALQCENQANVMAKNCSFGGKCKEPVESRTVFVAALSNLSLFWEQGRRSSLPRGVSDICFVLDLFSSEWSMGKLS